MPAPRSYLSKAIRPEMTVRQVAVDFPGSRSVFLGYGEPERPSTQFGHLEPLAQFASRRGIPLDELLSELAAATGTPIETNSRSVESVHHGYLVSALVITLTLGAGWGAWLLWQIGLAGDFGSVPGADVIAHGEAQLWGFIVLFILGISLRTVLQPMARHELRFWACRVLLALALFGVGASFACFLVPGTHALGLAAAVSFILLSAGFWAMQLALLYRKWRTTWTRAIMVSGLWLLAWAVVTACLRWRVGITGTGIYSDSERLLIIELAVFGFAMNSIYGFGQMLLPGLLRIGSTRGWAIELSHWMHNVGALLVCLATGQKWPRMILAAGCALLTTGAALFAIGNRAFIGRRRTSRREEQGYAPLDLYPPLAFFWLVASLLLLTGGALYEAHVQSPLPHAYTGAVRHALTVGFMTTLILGVGQRLLPVLDRTVLAWPGLIVPILVLTGVGNLTRVATEFATIVMPAAFVVMPFSALLEWTGLLMFAISAVTTMFRTDPLLSTGRVTSRSSLAVLLGEHSEIEDRLIGQGSRYLRRTRSVPRELTIASFAESERFDTEQLLNQLNAWLAELGRSDLGNVRTASARFPVTRKSFG